MSKYSIHADKLGASDVLPLPEGVTLVESNDAQRWIIVESIYDWNHMQELFKDSIVGEVGE